MVEVTLNENYQKLETLGGGTSQFTVQSRARDNDVEIVFVEVDVAPAVIINGVGLINSQVYNAEFSGHYAYIRGHKNGSRVVVW